MKTGQNITLKDTVWNDKAGRVKGEKITEELQNK